MSSQSGNVAELEVAAKLTRLGYIVSKPYDDHQRYDCIVDDGVKLYRMQIKRGNRREVEGRTPVIQFATATRDKDGVVHRYTADQVDGFLVWCADNEGIYWIPIADIPIASTAQLFLDTPKRETRKRQTLMASKYQICTRLSFQ